MSHKTRDPKHRSRIRSGKSKPADDPVERQAPPLWLPEPQERAVLPDLPGKRDDGKLWFED
jgi:hypothetical protein